MSGLTGAVAALITAASLFTDQITKIFASAKGNEYELWL